MKQKSGHITIAIDGPSGAGKSSLAKSIARELSISYVDTGALYRTVGYAVREAGVSPEDTEAVGELLGKIKVEVRYEDSRQNMYLDGEFLGDRIREHEISYYASAVSAIPAVRAFLLDTQKRIAAENSVVMDGRDIGTVIIPDADVKIFLSATVHDRAMRRWLELKARGEDADFTKIEADIASRDERDSTRATAPLVPASDAVLLDNSGFEPEQTLAAAMKILRSKLYPEGE